VGQRRRFAEEYRRDAASIVTDTGQTTKSVGVQMGHGEQLLSKWVSKERARRVTLDNGRPAPEDFAAETPPTVDHVPMVPNASTS